jgi:transketolase
VLTPAKEITHLAKSVIPLAKITALKMTSSAQSSHIGSALSVIEILSALYSAKKLTHEETGLDSIKIVFSKGHAAAGLYAVMHSLGYLTDPQIVSFCDDGSLIYGHVSHLVSPAIELSTGSLGHGLPFGLGIAKASKLNHQDATRVYVVISDGECDEGTTWESALLANQFELNNLCVIIDRNQIQSLGHTESILKLEPLRDKWESFGWNVLEVNGQDVNQITESIFEFNGPLCIIANTKKGAGVSFMEGQLAWHYKAPSRNELSSAIREIKSSQQ